MDHPGPVVDADWLTRHIEHPAVRIVDASFHLPDTGRDAAAEFVDAHIPGAVFFDFNRVADPANSLPRRFPPADVFAREVGRLGIDNDTGCNLAADAAGDDAMDGHSDRNGRDNQQRS